MALAALLVLAPVGPALACACCAEPGDRLVGVLELTDYERDELARLRSDGTATVHMTPCGEDCVRGVENLAASYRVRFAIDGRTWWLDMGESGALAFTLPADIERFAVDPAPEPGPTTELYSEWRIVSVITATGSFAAADGARAELVLHGLGNHCTSAETFSHWTLTLTGDGVDFRLFGKLGQPDR